MKYVNHTHLLYTLITTRIVTQIQFLTKVQLNSIFYLTFVVSVDIY